MAVIVLRLWILDSMMLFPSSANVLVRPKVGDKIRDTQEMGQCRCVVSFFLSPTWTTLEAAAST